MEPGTAHLPSQTQVIIIGAGPTGLSLAAQLLRYRIDFVILERNAHTTPLSKAVVVQARSLEIFDELGLSAKALQQGRLTTALNMFYKGRRKAFVDIKGLGEGLSPFPFALSLEQSKTETLLAHHLTDHQIPIHWQCALSRIEQDENSVTAYYTDATGVEKPVTGQYLVGCDGAGSLVRHQMGLPFEGDTVPKLFYVADVTLKSPVVNKDELFIFLIKKGFVLFFPMEGAGHYRIVGILPDADAGHPYTFDEIKGSVISQVAVPIEIGELRWFSTYKVHSRKAARFSKGRCLIAGDAAHIHTPAGGQGMNTGIQDAYNLAWKLALVIRQKTDSTVLQSYNDERGENARHLLRTTDRMFDMMAGTSSFWNFMRLHIFPLLAGLITGSAAVKKRIFPLLSQTGIAYPHSALTVPGCMGQVHAGDRMPYFLSEGKSVYSFISTPDFKLLCMGEGAELPDTMAWNNGIPLSARRIKEVPARLFGKAGAFYILLRPDNYIVYIGPDVNACREWLAKCCA